MKPSTLEIIRRTIIGGLLFTSVGFSFAEAPTWQLTQKTSAEDVSTVRSNVLIYRDKSDTRAKDRQEAVNVYINGEYLTTLLPGGYGDIALCPGTHRIQLAKRDALNGYAGKEQPGVIFNLKEGQKLGFKVLEGTPPSLQTLAEDQLTQAIDVHERQIHTISRVNRQDCTEVTKPLAKTEVLVNTIEPAKKVVNTVYTVAGRALFPFERHDPSSIDPSDLTQIKQIANDIKQMGSKVQRVEVIGHTDPVGSPKSNDGLSLSRAATVSDLLAQQGVNPLLFKLDGKGSAELVATGCTSKNKTERNKCNAPNRRVVIKVSSLQ